MKKSQPVLIGAFTLGAVILMFVGLFFLGGGGFWSDKKRYWIYFRVSVNGLRVGAPVKMRGVQIGKVTDILIQLHPKERTLLTRVEVEIDLDHLQSRRSQKGLFPWEGITMNELIDLGLRAQLKLQSFVTGLLYVDLDFYPDKPAIYVGLDEKTKEIPAIPSSQEEIESTIEEVVRRLRQIPFEEIARNLNETLKNLNRATEHLNRFVKQASFQRFPGRIERLIAHLDETTGVLRNELSRVASLLGENLKLSKQLIAHLDAKLARVDPLLKQTEETLAAAEKSFQHMEVVVSPDSEVVLQLEATLSEIERAAREIRHLAEMLQNHPESLLRGRR